VRLEARGGAARKRRCKREVPSDTDDDNADEACWDDVVSLAETMRVLITRSGVGGEDVRGGKMSSSDLVDAVHDGLVGIWEGPVAEHAVVPRELERKRAAWAKETESTKKRESWDLGCGQ
jgi:hypothetical protein